jgi:hypothetical protein
MEMPDWRGKQEKVPLRPSYSANEKGKERIHLEKGKHTQLNMNGKIRK